MLDPALLVGFVLASLVVLLIPGPGVAYVVARSVSQGQRAGLISAAGLSLGALVHAVAVSVGLSAILLTSATAFTTIKFLGAAYLIYLGIQTMMSRQSANVDKPVRAASHSRLFTEGVLITVLNPKVAVFFLAYLPQFTNPELGSVSLQLALLGIIYAFLALFTDGAYALLARRLREWLARGLGGPVLRYLGGSIYLGLGISTALQPSDALSQWPSELSKLDHSLVADQGHQVMAPQPILALPK